MRAVIQTRTGGPDTLCLGEAPDPVAGSADLLVRVAATALNRADVHQREGRYPPPPGASPILGLEMSGIVEAVGDDVTDFGPGDRVLALLSGGGYAERVAVPAAHALKMPDSLSMTDAAAIAEAFLTAFQAIFRIGGAVRGDSILIHAGASGVGTSAIQLVRESGIRCFVTCSAGKRDACERLGAERAIDYRTERFSDVVLQATEGRGVDLIVDVIGAPYLADNIEVLATDGRIVQLATMGGAVVESFDLRRLFRKRGTLVCSTLRNRSDTYKADLVAGFSGGWMDAIAAGRVAPVIDSVLDWSEVSAAHRRIEAGDSIGKIVLQIDARIS